MWWFSSGPADLPQINQKNVYGIIHLFCQMHEQYPYDQRLEEKVANGEQRWWHWQDKVLFTLIFIFYFFDKYDSAIKDRKVEIEPSTSGRGLQSQYAFILDMFLSQILSLSGISSAIFPLLPHGHLTHWRSHPTITHATLQICRFIANKDCIPVTLCVEDEPVDIHRYFGARSSCARLSAPPSLKGY